jgi:hypothetical protein
MMNVVHNRPQSLLPKFAKYEKATATVIFGIPLYRGT